MSKIEKLLMSTVNIIKNCKIKVTFKTPLINLSLAPS